MAFFAASCILVLLSDMASSYEYVYVSPACTYAPYKYASPPHIAHVHKHSRQVQHQPAPAKKLTAVVTGHVFCDLCKDGHLQIPLPGVTIGVVCWNGNAEYSFYGTTNKLGNFKVKLGRYDYHKHGGSESCRVKLIAPSSSTSCTVPTNLNGGKLGAHLKMKAKSLHELILKAGPFAYTSPVKNKKCKHSAKKSTSFYKHISKAPYKHSHLQGKYEILSCPAYDCESTIPPSQKHKPLELITNKHKKLKTAHETNRALPPNPEGYIDHPSSFYLRYKKKSSSI